MQYNTKRKSLIARKLSHFMLGLEFIAKLSHVKLNGALSFSSNVASDRLRTLLSRNYQRHDWVIRRNISRNLRLWTHTNELKPLPLTSLHGSFTPNWKHCSLANPILHDSSSSPYLPPRLNSKHHPPYPSDCLSAWLSESWPLPIDFVLVKRLWINWFPRLRFCGRCRNLEFVIMITIITCRINHFY